MLNKTFLCGLVDSSMFIYCFNVKEAHFLNVDYSVDELINMFDVTCTDSLDSVAPVKKNGLGNPSLMTLALMQMPSGWDSGENTGFTSPCLVENQGAVNSVQSEYIYNLVSNNSQP